MNPRGRLARAKRITTNAFLVAWLGVITIDATPARCEAHVRAQDAVDPALDRSGLWQGTWKLFAPQVDKINTRVHAVVSLEDGSTVTWAQPDWESLGPWGRMRHFRDMEYFDSVRLDENRGAWPGLAAYIARAVARQSKQEVVRVELFRDWHEIGAPQGEFEPFPGPRTLEGRYRFFVMEPPGPSDG